MNIRRSSYWIFLLSGLWMTSACNPEPVLPAEGDSWLVDLNTAQWVAPTGVTELIESFGTDYPFFLGVRAVNGLTADLILAIADASATTQDMCNRTIIMPGVTFEDDGRFQYGPSDFTIANGVTTLDLAMDGVLNPDQAAFGQLAMSGTVIIDTMPDDMFPLPEALTMCEVMEAFDIPCAPCPDGTSNCLYMELDAIETQFQPGLNLVEVTEVDCHSLCDLSLDNPDCDLSSL
jgi:hypothetical protein